MWTRQGPHLREGDGEVETLPEASEGDEGLGREAPGGHLTVGPLKLAGRAQAMEAADEQVHAGAPVLAHAIGAAAGACIHLAVLSCRTRAETRGGDTAGPGRSKPRPGAPEIWLQNPLPRGTRMPGPRFEMRESAREHGSWAAIVRVLLSLEPRPPAPGARSKVVGVQRVPLSTP